MGLADSTAAMKLLFQGENQTDGVVAAVEANTSKVSKAAMGVKAAWAVAGAATSTAVGFLGEAARASVADAADVESLRQAVENSGESWDAVSGKINDRIKAGQHLAFTDDQVRDSLSLLTAQTGDMGEAMTRQSLAFDLARGAHIDLQTASKLLGKVTDENSNALARYGIHVKAQVQNAKVLEGLQKNVATAQDGVSAALRAEQELRVSLSGKHKKSTLDLLHLEDAHKRVTKAQGNLKDAQVALTKEQDKETGVTEVLAQVQAKFGGQADTYSKTTAAAAFRMKDGFDEWKESVGGALGAAQPFVSLLPGISTGMTIAGGAMGPVAKGLLDVAKSARVAAVGTTILNIAMGPVGLIILAIAGAVALLALAWANNWGDIRGKTKAVLDVVGPALAGFFSFMQGLWQTAGPIIQAAARVILTPIFTIIDTVTTAVSLLERLGILKHKVQVTASDIAAARGNVAGVRGSVAAASGYDGWVTKPTLFMTGEAGPEHVKVTPQGQAGQPSVVETHIHLELDEKELAHVVDRRLVKHFG